MMVDPASPPLMDHLVEPTLFTQLTPLQRLSHPASVNHFTTLSLFNLHIIKGEQTSQSASAAFLRERPFHRTGQDHSESNQRGSLGAGRLEGSTSADAWLRLAIDGSAEQL